MDSEDTFVAERFSFFTRTALQNKILLDEQEAKEKTRFTETEMRKTKWVEEVESLSDKPRKKFKIFCCRRSQENME